MDSDELRALSNRTREVYERNAARFDRERSRGLHERTWLDRFAALVPAGGRLLDVGCGSAEPVAAYFAGLGFAVTGVDISLAMLEIARDRFPEGDWRHADMRMLDLGETFDGVVAWDSFFHLTQDEQRDCLPLLAGHLEPGAPLLVTVGPSAGEVTGHVGDDAVYHASLDADEYAAILAAAGVEVVSFVGEDPQCDFHTLLLARKRGV